MTTSGMNEDSVLKGTALRLSLAIAGCKNAFPAGIPTLPIRNGNLSQADIANTLQTLNAPFVSVQAAHSTVQQFSTDKPQHVALAAQFLHDLKSSLGGAVGTESEILGQWGFKPKKARKPLTSEQAVLRAAKAKLTRQKRGTLGKRQKAAIKQVETPSVQIKSDGTSTILAPGSNGNGSSPSVPAGNGSVTAAH